MIAQVAVTVICIPPAIGIWEDAWRDRRIRAQFPGQEYLAVRIGLDQDMAAGESDAAFAVRANNTYAELERRLAQEAGVTAVTFAEQLPGMHGDVRRRRSSARDELLIRHAKRQDMGVDWSKTNSSAGPVRREVAERGVVEVSCPRPQRPNNRLQPTALRVNRHSKRSDPVAGGPFVQALPRRSSTLRRRRRRIRLCSSHASRAEATTVIFSLV